VQLSFLPERVAIVGSREFKDLDWVREYVLWLPAGTLVVTGGARGVDVTAERAAKARKDLPPPKVLHAGWQRPDGTLDRAAGHKRNRRVVAACDRLVAFWDGQSPGTRDAFQLAEAAGKPYRILMVRMRGTNEDPICLNPQ
jgi:hypothetical protein